MPRRAHHRLVEDHDIATVALRLLPLSEDFDGAAPDSGWPPPPCDNIHHTHRREELLIVFSPAGKRSSLQLRL